MIRDADRLLEEIRAIHAAIRAEVVAACERSAVEQLAAVVAEDEGGDTIFAIDRVSEAVLVDQFAALAQEWPCVLVAEGLGTTGEMVLPAGIAREQAAVIILVDPIDGTRGLMYQKRPAWILTGLAPNRGAETRLRDIVLAVQTEIPLVKQHLCDQLWAVRGEGVESRRVDRLTGRTEPLALRPSRADTTAHGFASVSRFFPGARDVLAAIDDEVATAVLGPPQAGKAACFEDQYISSGGQLYELMVGHDRYIADLRPLLRDLMLDRGLPHPLCCHPYDLCTILIAEELGLPITGPTGAPLDAPLDLESDVAWIGYANDALRRNVEPALIDALRRRGLLSPD